MQMKGRTLLLVIGAVSIVALAAMFGVSRATASTAMHRVAAGTQGDKSGCSRIMGNPTAMKAMQPLHAEHVKDMQAWRDRYGSDPKSAEAKAALATMRREHVREMRTAFKKLGIKVPAGACSRSMMDGTSGAGMMDGTNGAGMMGGDATGMMGGAGASSDIHQQHHGTSDSGADGASNMMGGSTSGMMGGTF
jgi:hypothetical protein